KAWRQWRYVCTLSVAFGNRRSPAAADGNRQGPAAGSGVAHGRAVGAEDPCCERRRRAQRKGGQRAGDVVRVGRVIRSAGARRSAHADGGDGEHPPNAWVRGGPARRTGEKGARRARACSRNAAPPLTQGDWWPGVVVTVPTLPNPGVTPLGGLAFPGAGAARFCVALGA